MSLFLLFILSCNDEDKEKLEFINDIIQHPENMDSIIKRSKFSMNSDNFYEIKSIAKFLIEHPIKLKDIKSIGPVVPAALINDKYVKFHYFSFAINYEHITSINFDFVQLSNGEWKLKELYFLINYP
jgi:hypothetical protein